MWQRWLVGCWVLIANGALMAADELTIGGQPLQLAAGYRIERIAGPPLVERPIAVTRDERGRLYVTDSAGMTANAEQQLAAKPHRIRRLEDVNGDGIYDTSVVFADRLMFPEGCLWHEGSLYVAAPPEIWKFTDADDDGVAEQREVWFDGKTLTGCANDLHGPYLGPDSRIYWCKGAFAKQDHALADGRLLTTTASHIFRARPDGSEREVVLTGGMDNPVNVAWSSTGERFLSCTFFQHPEAGRRDGLIHSIYGGVYGKDQSAILNHPRTGGVMPVMTHMGAAAPCGLVCGSRSLFGGGSQDVLFLCNFNLHSVTRHVLQPDFATFTTQDDELLSCDHPDFHPTDVFEDADGSLLVVDTGGWYKLCCPTSQLAKPDVLGAIYRVRKADQPVVRDPQGLKLAWHGATPEELVSRLGDERLFVRKRAMKALRSRPKEALPALEFVVHADRVPLLTREAVWTLCGIDDFAARMIHRRALRSNDRETQQIAIYACGLWRDAETEKLLPELALGSDPVLASGAVQAMGRARHPQTAMVAVRGLEELPVEELIDSDEWGTPLNAAVRTREHTLIYALIERGDPSPVRACLKSRHAGAVRGGLVALDQMPNSSIELADVLPLLLHPSPAVSRTANWVAQQHPEWSDALTEHYSAQVTHVSDDAAERVRLARQLGAMSRTRPMQRLIAAGLLLDRPQVSHQLMFAAMQHAGLSTTPEEWIDALCVLLPHAQGETLSEAVQTANRLPLPKGGDARLRQALKEVGLRSEVPLATRLLALQGAQPLDEVTQELLTLLLEAVATGETMPDRGAAAAVVASAKLTSQQLMRVVEWLPRVGAMELPKLLSLFETAPNAAAMLPLAEMLNRLDAGTTLRADFVRKLFQQAPADAALAIQPLLGRLQANAAQQAEQLEALLAQLPPGDAVRGHAVFIAKKSACLNCHAHGYSGGRLGPDLTAIGKVRTVRDLVEAIVYPNASIVRGYEPVVIQLVDGRSMAGIIQQETPSELTLAIDAQKRMTVARKDIEEMSPAAVSVMPEGLLKVLSVDELADLVAFLKHGLQ